MENNVAKKSAGADAKNVLKKAGEAILHRFFIIILLAAAAYAVFIWNKYIVNAEWSEEKKKAYVEEQSVFSFDQKSFQQAQQLVDERQKRLESGSADIQRDIFFPEGF